MQDCGVEYQGNVKESGTSVLEQCSDCTEEELVTKQWECMENAEYQRYAAANEGLEHFVQQE